MKKQKKPATRSKIAVPIDIMILLFDPIKRSRFFFFSPKAMRTAEGYFRSAPPAKDLRTILWCNPWCNG